MNVYINKFFYLIINFYFQSHKAADINSTSLDNDYFTHANQTLDKNEHNIDSDHIYTRIYPLCDMTISYSMYLKLQPACSNSSEDGISSNF